jgi:hypothetical protein
MNQYHRQPDGYLDGQEILRFFLKTESLLPFSQEPATGLILCQFESSYYLTAVSLRSILVLSCHWCLGFSFQLCISMYFS